MMGGVDWQAIPIMAEIFGVQDVEIFIEQLVTIRDNPK